MSKQELPNSPAPPNPNPTIRLSLPATEKPGEKIGRYKLLQLIGEGGMGSVWMAEQEEPVRRRVALKVIKLGMDTKQVIGRFEAERQALALMDHPNIAKVLDAGSTENGRPFFAMELVKGIPITRYCDDNKLSTEERLKLFTDVCHAIQHAHQKGIIHRDIKPSNILVTLNDGVPMPKVIDFGIAKATGGQTLTDKTVFTALEQFIGTPAYMSPEQAEMNSLDIDTRSDIYALGVLLYELLTGKTPFDPKDLLAKGLDEIRRIIREEEPPRPSTRLSTLDAAEQTILANQRHSEPPKLLGIIRGDLDWIVMKTLEKDRTRRYQQANGLAKDIQRFLVNEPVLARPPSTLYRLQRLFRRNQLAFAAGAALVFAVAFGITIGTWQADRTPQISPTDKEQHNAQIESPPATNNFEVIHQQPQNASAEALEHDEQIKTNSAAVARQNEQQYQAAMTMGNDALSKADFNRALAQAAIALDYRTNDTAALKLKTDAQTGLKNLLAQAERERNYLQAIFAGRSALMRNEYAQAIGEAQRALGYRTNDAEAQALRANAETMQKVALGERERRHQASLKAARDAMADKEYAAALAILVSALKIKPADAEALELKTRAEESLDLGIAQSHFTAGNYAKASELCNKHASLETFRSLATSINEEQDALDAAVQKFSVGYYSFIEQLKEQSYASKKPFTELISSATTEKKLLGDLQALRKSNKWQEVKKQLADPTAASLKSKPPFSELAAWTDEQSKDFETNGGAEALAKLDTELETMLVMFRVKRSDPRPLNSDVARQQSLGAIGAQTRHAYVERVDWLRLQYTTLSRLTPDRQKNLESLKRTIQNWD